MELWIKVALIAVTCLIGLWILGYLVALLVAGYMVRKMHREDKDDPFAGLHRQQRRRRGMD